MGLINVKWKGASLKQDASNRLVTDKEKTTWNNKANGEHTHAKSDIKDFPSSLPASDVYSWAKASSKPSYSKSEVGLGNVDNTADSIKSVKYATSAGNANALNWVAGNEIKFTKPNYTTEQDLHFCWSWADNSKVKLIKQYIFDGGDGNPTQVKASQFNGPLNGNASSASSVPWSGVTGKPSTFTPSSHTHNTIQDINNSQNVTFAYSKAGMDYGDYTWLAAWNGEELRAVAKGQFATASHTHSYVPLSGGTITGNILPSKNNSYYLGKENSAFYQITGQNIYAQYLKPINNTSTIGVYTDPWNAGHFESLRSGTISCSKVLFFPSGQNKTLFPDTYLSMNCLTNSSDSKSYGIINFYYDKNIVSLQPTIGSNARSIFLPNASGTLQISSSDIRLKDNVKDSNINALEFINKIKIRQFDWKESGKGHQDIGFIADELEELDSNLSVGGGTDISEYKNENGKCIKKEIMNVKCVNTFYLQGYEVKAIQELSSKVDNKVDALEKENNKLKDIINQLLERVTTLENK